jgi:thiosulfate reductase cytochrome b subunit
MSEEKLYLYPVWVRLWHLSNAILILTLIVTGVSMQFTAEQSKLVRFDTAVAIHNVAGILLTISYLFFFIGNLFTLNGKSYQLEYRGLFGRLKKQFLYYLIGIFTKQSPPFPVTRENKFNPLQQFSYVFVMYLFVPLVFLTGWFMLYPETIPLKIFGGSGLHTMDFIHILSGFVISIFLVVHIYFCTCGKSPKSNFKSILNGYHDPH